MDLIRARQRLIDAPYQVRHAVRGIQTLVRIHLPGIVGVRRHLPAAHINGLQPSLHLLDRLVAGHRAERRHIRLRLQ